MYVRICAHIVKNKFVRLMQEKNTLNENCNVEITKSQKVKNNLVVSGKRSTFALGIKKQIEYETIWH